MEFIVRCIGIGSFFFFFLSFYDVFPPSLFGGVKEGSEAFFCSISSTFEIRRRKEGKDVSLI